MIRTADAVTYHASSPSSSPLEPFEAGIAVAASNGSDDEEEGPLTWCVKARATLTAPQRSPPSYATGLKSDITARHIPRKLIGSCKPQRLL